MDVCATCLRTSPCDPCKMNAWKQLHTCAWCDKEGHNMRTVMQFQFCSNPCQHFFFERYPHLWRGG